MATDRQRRLRKALTDLVPHCPLSDFTPIYQEALQIARKDLPPSIAAWLAAVAHIRHAHTDYEKLLGEGYEQSAARHFTRGQINDVLRKWGCGREVGESE